MTRSLLLVVALLFVGAGCAVDPVGDCESVCTARVEGGCAPAGTTDCMAQCASAQQDYDRDRANASTAQCTSEFDSLYGCLTGGDVCDSRRCDAEGAAATECFFEFCTSVPTSPVCANP